MTGFAIRFLACNLCISVIIVLLFAVKSLLGKSLPSRSQYRLWFPLLGLLAVPFLPLEHIRFPAFPAWFHAWKPQNASAQTPGNIPDSLLSARESTGWMNDFAISASQKAPSVLGAACSIVWICGMAFLLFSFIKSMLHLSDIRQSALPLQNAGVRSLYRHCLVEMHIRRSIPVRSTAFIKSPMISGLFFPCIYLPASLISDYDAVSMRYMLLHELSHYRQKDTLASCLMNTARIVYWFNPLVHLALREMHTDREIACDAFVLDLLCESDYESYGQTLLAFADRISRMPAPFCAGISTGMAQMKKRILHIAGYRPATLQKHLLSLLCFLLITALLCCFIPLLHIRASDDSKSRLPESGRQVSEPDLSSILDGYDAGFVLYDTKSGTWQIYNKESALTRSVPASTFKIYSALLALENGTITPEQSLLGWNGQNNVYDSWNRDQTLDSAMRNSVTWYFQTLDAQAGPSAIQQFIRDIGYGNQDAGNDAATYWMDASLKISPVEQVQMLQKLYDNAFGFQPEHIEAVKRAIRIDASRYGLLYGKTGTVAADGKNICGWFIGFVEKEDSTCFFALNIQKDSQAGGPEAVQLAGRILEYLQVWK